MKDLMKELVVLAIVGVVFLLIPAVGLASSYVLDTELGVFYPYLRMDTSQTVYDDWYLARGQVKLTVPWLGIGLYGIGWFSASIDDYNEDAGDEVRYGLGIAHTFMGQRSYLVKDDGLTRVKWVNSPVFELDVSYHRENRIDFSDDLADYDVGRLWLFLPAKAWWPQPYVQAEYFHSVYDDGFSGWTWPAGLKVGEWVWGGGRFNYLGRPYSALYLYINGNDGVFGFDAEAVSTVAAKGAVTWGKLLWGIGLTLEGGYQYRLDQEAENSIAEDEKFFGSMALSYSFGF